MFNLTGCIESKLAALSNEKAIYNLNWQVRKMLQQKKQKIRLQYRRAKLEEIFAVRRMELILSCPESGFSPHTQLDKKIKANLDPEMNLELICQLQQLLIKYPADENSYVLVGNYLIEHPNAYRYFRDHIMEVQDKEHLVLMNFSWIVLVALHTIHTSQRDYLPDCFEYDIKLGSVLSSDLLKCNRQNNKIVDYFLISVNVLLNSAQKAHFPYKSVKVFCGLLRELLADAFRNNRHSRMKHAWEVVESLSECLPMTDLNGEIDTLCHSLSPLIHFCLTAMEMYESRRSCIACLQKLFDFYPCSAMQILEPQVIKEILYQFQQSNALKDSISTLLGRVLPSLGVRQLCDLLNFRLHVLCYESLDYAITHQNWNCVFYSLKCIDSIMDKLKEENEQKILNHVELDLSTLHFQATLQTLSEKRLDDRIEKIVATILDNYAMDEEEEGY